MLPKSKVLKQQELSAYELLALKLTALEVENAELHTIQEEVNDLKRNLESLQELQRFYEEKLLKLNSRIESYAPFLDDLWKEKTIESELRRQRQRQIKQVLLLEEERTFINKYVFQLENSIYNSKVLLTVNKRVTQAAKGVKLN
mmetsp:Transcript_1350/g.3120  ORF Transcript_1350/g.3120 Transcript_1350/m.3120 type:complete len:144 (-) Transcript_1350:56-487(-)